MIAASTVLPRLTSGLAPVPAFGAAFGQGFGQAFGQTFGQTLRLVCALTICAGVTLGAQERAVTTTAHPPLPADPSHYWVIPEPSASATNQEPAASLTDFARGVALIGEEDFGGALPLVSDPGLQATPLAQYARYYTGVALLGLERPDEAATTLAPLEGKVEGYLQDAVPLRLAEAALAREVPAAAVGILEKASIYTVIAPEEVLLRLGTAMEAAGESERALRTYRRVYDEFPMSEQAMAAEEATEGLKSQPGIPADRVRALLARAQRLFEARQWNEASAGFAPLLPLVTGDDRELVTLRLAECDNALNRRTAARDSLAPLLTTATREAEARYVHLTATRAIGQHTRFVALARGLVTDHPSSPWAEDTLNDLASHYITIDEEEKADEVFRELVRRFPGGRYADRAAWKIGWFAYKHDRFADVTSTFEAAAVASPRANYRPSWLYWAARAHDQLGNESAGTALYRVVASDYLNSYYGRLASTLLSERGEPPVPPTVVIEAANAAPSAPDPATAVPNAEVIRALASVELYDQALQEAEYAGRAWGESSALQATRAWLRYQRAGQPQAAAHFADLRGAITTMRRAYPQFMAAGGEQLPPHVLQVIFPLEYWPLIKKYSDAHDLDPYLITALVAQESTFTVDVRSSANAVGLMQLIPGTARRYAAKLGIRYSNSVRTQAETNIRLGMRYFKDLMNRFGGAHFALASYNAGEGRIARWIRERPGFAQDEFIDDIPYLETQNYVKRILGTAEDYRRLYDDGVLRTVPMAR
jgi:soluble lytic murein transglycosylase